MKMITKGTIATLTLMVSSLSWADDIRNAQWLQQQLNSEVQSVLQQMKAELPNTQQVAKNDLAPELNKASLVARQPKSKNSERRVLAD
ncbi:hypothetical protein HMF8227_01018 [Saliniradius amylolyticus]|uniref:Uncharacterized protein n=1 Tax=Saliniradius amylolyticus TaxID=2183582 RepID=A0A2S2E3C4_9ALTE|nr:hypothetical protein [Saliniradius amylolyticus]AWL11507.1 hypothetical protein HMF8227_01018 [Saliniradius amylolyticus]